MRRGTRIACFGIAFTSCVGAIAGWFFASSAPAHEDATAPKARPNALCTARGRVVDRRGKPVAGIAVAIVDWNASAFIEFPWQRNEYEPKPIGTTDEHGEFVARDLDPRYWFTVWVDRDGPRSSSRDFRMIGRPGVEVTLDDVAIHDPRTIRGRVVDDAGHPLRGAIVRVVRRSEVASGGPGFARSVGALLTVQRDSDDAPWRLSRRASSDDDPPAMRRPTATSAEDGTFVVSGDLRDGDRVVVHATLCRAGAAGPFLVRDGAPVDAGDVVLSLGGRRVAHVTDRAGSPVAGAEVFAGRTMHVPDPEAEDVSSDDEAAMLVWTGPFPASPTARSGTLVLAGTTDAGGNVTLSGLEENDDAFVALTTDGASGIANALPTEPLSITIEPPLALTVRVLGPNGVPCPNAAINVDCGFEPLDVRGRVTSPEAGVFRISGLPPARYDVRARAAGTVPEQTTAALFAKDADTTIQLAADQPLEVRVRSAQDGEPIAGAQVAVVTPRHDTILTMKSSRTLTGASGDATVRGLPAGKFDAWIRHPDFAPVHRHVTLPCSAIDVTLGRGGRIESRATTSTLRLLRPRSVSVTGDGTDARLETDLDGHFALERLAPGHYEVTLGAGFELREIGGNSWRRHGDVMLPNGEKVNVRVVDGETTWVEFASLRATDEPRCTIHGVVEINGAPAPRLRVIANCPGSNGIERLTDAAGRFDFGSLPAGRIFVAVPQQEQPDGVDLYTDLVSEFRVFDVGEDAELRLSAKTGRVAGRVVDAASGAPIADAEVEIETGRNECGSDSSMMALTDHDGRFDVEPVLAGDIRFEVHARDYGDLDVEEPAVLVDRQALASIVLKMTRGVTVRGRVVMPPEMQGAEALFLCFEDPHSKDGAPSERGKHDVDIDSDTGEFEANGVVPGDYRVEFVLPDYKTVDAVMLTVPPEGLENVKLEPRVKSGPQPVRFAGTIQIPPDAPPVIDELLLRRGAGKDVEETRVDAGYERGVLHFGGRPVPPGHWRVWPLPHWQSFTPLDVDVPEGGIENLTLKFALAPPSEKK